MFSSEGKVSSIIITFFVDLEKSNRSGRRVETAKSTGPTNIPSKSNSKFQSEAECNKPRKPLQGAALGFFPDLTKLMKSVTDDLFGLYDERKFVSITTNSQRTLSCLKLKRPSWSAILQAPEICAEVQILFSHKKQDDSVIGLQRFKLLGLGSVSNVVPKHNEIKEEGIASNVFQERSFFTKSRHSVQ